MEHRSVDSTGAAGAAEIIFLVFLSGAAMAVVEATGAIGRVLDQLTERFGRRPWLVLPLASALFLIGGNTYWNVRRDSRVHPHSLHPHATASARSGDGGGRIRRNGNGCGAFSPCNTFLLGVSQPLAQLGLFSGFAFRSVLFVAAMAIWAGYLAWFAARTQGRVSPEMSSSRSTGWRRGDLAVLATLNGGMLVVVLGGIFLHWELRHVSAVFVAVGLFAGLAGGLGWRGTSEQFAEGCRRMALAAMLVGFSRAISVVLTQGGILDTIANALFSPLRHLSVSGAAVICSSPSRRLPFRCRAIPAGR